MSVKTELDRLKKAKADMTAALAGKGVTVPASAKLDGYAALISAIPVSSAAMLWENASPGSTFAAQTISVPGIEQYDFIMIGASYSKYNDVDCSLVIRVSKGTGGYLTSSRAVNEYSVYAQTRYCKIADSAILFEDSYLLMNGGKASKDNTTKIPLFVLGIRGVL